MLVQPEMERRRSPLACIPPLGRGFSRHRYDCQANPRHGCIPALPASVSPDKVIVAPSRPSVSRSGSFAPRTVPDICCRRLSSGDGRPHSGRLRLRGRPDRTPKSEEWSCVLLKHIRPRNNDEIQKNNACEKFDRSDCRLVQAPD